MDAAPETFVYILRSLNSGRPYVGVTADVRTRLAHHNAGKCKYTSHFRPWTLVVTTQFEAEKRALDFERYLKSGSGWAFSKRHFL